ncbi:phospholipase D family protein [Variovorax sp. dw_308]|uniref:phospholipase D family protein n=1 Tax=Variovorax sp. dw_308 TaxID=2721546 RepID=UPI001C47CF00|nr:phospholipase D family protein [Variovorax sp. dw_308]
MLRPLRWTLALLIAIGLLTAGGCAELPTQVDRPVSHALASAAGTPFATLVRQRHDAANARSDSGFLLLDGPQAAYGSRLALVDGAQKTLDLQYYAIHADASTRRLMRAVREAAARGVRVRILIDDFHSTGRDALVLQLAYVENIEVRLFNPLAGARGSTIGRLFSSIDDASRIQQRMHNKLFLADNVFGVAGGRNLGDAYFGVGESGNFVDLDVLAAGPIVQDLSRSFDTYWNNERAYPVQSLVKREELDRIRDEARADDASKPEAEKQPAGARRAVVWDEQPIDLAQADFTWAPAVVLADKPGKIASSAEEAASASPAAARASGREAVGLQVSLPAGGQRKGNDASGSRGQAAMQDVGGGRQATVQDAAHAAAGGDTLVEGLLQLIGQAQSDLLIISPYFVPGPDITQALSALHARGIRVRVLTNSLASNDAPVAHVGYARHREALLKLGVDLYELRSEQAGINSAFGSSGSVTGQSHSMLHSKVLVMDKRLVVIGSMNLDLRSQKQNTEVALLIGSRGLSGDTTELIEKTLREGAWHVELVDGRLTWRAPQGSGLQDTTTEPDASPGLRLMLKVIGPLAPDSML